MNGRRTIPALLLLILLPLTVAASERSLGLIVQPDDQSDDQSSNRGLTVIALTPNGPARAAGIRRGDRLLAIGEQSLAGDDGRALDRYVQESSPGEPIELSIERDGQRRQIRITPEAVAARPDDDGDPFVSDSGGRIPALDGELIANHDGLADYFGTREGVVVLRAAPDNAWQVKSGDVILRVGGQPVRQPSDISRVVRRSGPGPLTIDVLRAGGPQALEVVIGRDWPALTPDPCSKSDVPSTTPSSDFDVIGDGSAVRHRATGLEWQRCALGQRWNGATCLGRPDRLTWPDATERVGALGGGWRLPRINELQSIVEHCRHNPSINRQAFPNTPAQWFWSSTESDRPLPRVWVVWFSRGGVDDYHRGSAIFARPVRGQPDPDFVLPR